ncbi:hypothetical protein KC366_g19177, partial [Hortaea werneckii]
YWQIHNWMLAMSNYPPPPQPDQHHYNALYPASAGAQQLLDPVQQEQLQYANLSTPPYPKVESGTPEQNAAQLRNFTADLEQHAHLEEQQRQQIQQAAQHLHHQQSTPHTSESVRFLQYQEGEVRREWTALSRMCCTGYTLYL